MLPAHQEMDGAMLHVTSLAETAISSCAQAGPDVADGPGGFCNYELRLMTLKACHRDANVTAKNPDESAAERVSDVLDMQLCMVRNVLNISCIPHTQNFKCTMR